MIAAVACTEKPTEDPTARIVKFRVDVTKATDTAFESGDQISLFAGSPISMSNVKLTYTAGALNPSTTVLWGEGQTSATTFEAVYPYSSSFTSASVDFAVKTDQSTESNFKASDLMYASTSQTPGNIVALNFTHQMAKLTVQVDNQSSRTIQSVSAGSVKTTYNPVTKTASGSAVVTGYKAGNDTWVFYLAPQTTPGKIFVHTTGGELEYEGTFTLVSGKASQCPITIEPDTPTPPQPGEASFSCTVSDWQQGGVINFSPVEGGGGDVPTGVVDATVAQVKSEQNTNVTYKLSGIVSGFNSQYCSFDLTDNTGSIYVYSVTSATKAEYTDKLQNGDIVTIEGKYTYYEPSSKHEIIDAEITSWTSAGGGDTPDGEPIVTLTFPDDNNANNHVGSYTSDWVAKSGSYTFNISCFNNNNWSGNWTFIRGGYKSGATKPYIATADAIAKAVGSVSIAFDKNDASIVNSAKLITATDAGFTKNVKSVDIPMEIGTKTVTVPSPAQNLYYKLDFDLNTASANGVIQISKIIFFGVE